MARKRDGEGLKRRIEERNGIKYVYESTSEMRNGEKVSISTYIGKLDDNGDLIPKQKRMTKAEREDARKEIVVPAGAIRSKAYGNVHFLNGLQDQIGIRKDLEASFGPFGDQVLALAFAQTIQPGAFSETENVLNGTAVREVLDVKTSLSSPGISEITRSIGEADACTDRFFDLRLNKCGNVVAWDTTTNGTYTERTGMAEWGNSKDDEKLMHIKVGLATDSRGIPVLTELFPGSLSDVVLTRRFAARIKSSGKDFLFVADNGFESGINIQFLMEEGIRFAMPANVSGKAVKKLMTDFRNTETYDRVHDGHSYRVAETQLAVVEDGGRRTSDGSQAYSYLQPDDDRFVSSETKIRAFVCYDSKKYSDGEQRLKIWLDSIEKQLDGKTFRNPQKEFARVAGKAVKYFDVTYEDKTVRLKRRRNAVSFADNRAGMFVMLTSPDVTWEQMMSAYDARRLTEQAFDAQKNGLDGRRFRTGDKYVAIGRFFVKMVALIMRCEMCARIREKKLRTTAEGILLSTGNILAARCGNVRGLTEITKTNREIFDAFGISRPKDEDVTNI